MKCNKIGRTWNDDICIIMEKMDTTLYEEIRGMPEQTPEWLIWYYFVLICKGVQYLNSLNIIHQDIKPMNVLIKYIDDSRPILTDYTLSIVLQDEVEYKIQEGEKINSYLKASEQLIDKVVKQTDTW